MSGLNVTFFNGNTQKGSTTFNCALTKFHKYPSYLGTDYVYQVLLRGNDWSCGATTFK